MKIGWSNIFFFRWSQWDRMKRCKSAASICIYVQSFSISQRTFPKTACGSSLEYLSVPSIILFFFFLRLPSKVLEVRMWTKCYTTELKTNSHEEWNEKPGGDFFKKQAPSEERMRSQHPLLLGQQESYSTIQCMKGAWCLRAHAPGNGCVIACRVGSPRMHRNDSEWVSEPGWRLVFGMRTGSSICCLSKIGPDWQKRSDGFAVKRALTPAEPSAPPNEWSCCLDWCPDISSGSHKVIFSTDMELPLSISATGGSEFTLWSENIPTSARWVDAKNLAQKMSSFVFHANASPMTNGRSARANMRLWFQASVLNI